MHRLWCLVIIGALAVAVSVVGAGPAFAAKGGNDETAHACQKGGHAHRLDGTTHRPFKNAGDCVNNGAKGEDSEFLYIDTSSTYGCLPPMTGICWGLLDANGLSVGEQWQVFFPADGPPPNGTTPFRTGKAESSEEFQVILNLPCGQGSTSAYAVAPADNVSDTEQSPAGC